MTTAADRVHAALGELRTAVDALNRGVGDVESTTVEEAAAALAELRDLISPLRQCEAGLERWIAQCFRAEGWDLTHELVGVGMVEVRRSTQRRAWDHEAVRRDWVNAWLLKFAEESNEGPDVYDAIDACMGIASVSGYKVTWMRQLGMDPDDYCESSPGAPRVVLA